MKPTWWVIQNVAIEGPGLLGEVLAEAGLSTRIVPVWDGAAVPSSPDGAAGIVILGGPMGVYERDRFPFIDRELALARRAVETGVPFLGICLGSQILAEAMGGRVHPGPRAELGWAPVTLSEEGRSDPVLGGGTDRFEVFHWHGDTFELPPGALRLASSALYPNQAFRWGRLAYGLQFHLEFTPGIVRAVLDDPGNRRWMKEHGPEGLTRAEIAADTDARVPACAALGREVFRRFLTLARR